MSFLLFDYLAALYHIYTYREILCAVSYIDAVKVVDAGCRLLVGEDAVDAAGLECVGKRKLGILVLVVSIGEGTLYHLDSSDAVAFGLRAILQQVCAVNVAADEHRRVEVVGLGAAH